MRKTITLILISLVTGIFLGRNNATSQISETAKGATITTTVSTKDKKTFTKDSVIAFMKKLNIKHLEFTYAQSQLESGNFSSPIFIENHNLFGLKRSYQRPTPTKKVNRNHAKYDNWKESVIDFAIFQARVLAKTKGKEEYMVYIKKFYSEDDKYLEKVNNIVEENRKCGLF